MSRKLRIEYPGAMNHLMSSGLRIGGWTCVSNLLNEQP